MKTRKWHRFVEDEVGDDTCADCAVQVTLEAHMTFSLHCPAGDCSSEKNPDRGCVFTPAGSEPSRCLFCGRSGDRDTVPDTSVIPPEDLADDDEPQDDEDTEEPE